jgi:hypothetical protein
MPIFTARIERPIPKYKNPFLPLPNAPFVRCDFEVREWDVEADTEQVVRDWFNEAKTENHINVRGFSLVSVVERV